jgi:hypothetical protein
MNKQSWTLTRGGHITWGLDEGLTFSRFKNGCYEILHRILGMVTCEHGNEPSGSIKGVEFLD